MLVFQQDNSICENPYITIQMFCATSLTDVILLSSSDKGSVTLLIYLINHLVDLPTEDYVEIKIALIGAIKGVSILIAINSSHNYYFYFVIIVSEFFH